MLVNSASPQCCISSPSATPWVNSHNIRYYYDIM